MVAAGSPGLPFLLAADGVADGPADETVTVSASRVAGCQVLARPVALSIAVTEVVARPAEVGPPPRGRQRLSDLDELLVWSRPSSRPPALPASWPPRLVDPPRRRQGRRPSARAAGLAGTGWEGLLLLPSRVSRRPWFGGCMRQYTNLPRLLQTVSLSAVQRRSGAVRVEQAGERVGTRRMRPSL